ncbi:acyltransferase family protein [Rhizobium mongolense]|uniref:acyltransferase family protein n=1 Tax=Rhizobium mongolense TaxID=57676 RepID=UPI0035566875
MILSQSRPSYRAELDGLRAVAVIPVVLYHIGLAWLPGGFVGVDVFFVLSGYFMARIISSEIAAGSFNIWQFYGRRIRRILPALTAVLAASTIAAWFLFMPQEFEYFAKSLIGAATFTANILFQKESGYFDLEAHTKPLLHTWSLSVEEQFYIFFPLTLLLTRKSRAVTLAVLIAAFFLSFAASCWAAFNATSQGFYLLPFRVWELLLGSLVALVPAPKLTQRSESLMAGVGLLGIVAAFFAYNVDTPFPGYYALLPCLSAAAVIFSRAEGSWSYALLKAPPMMFIGKISYSVYLWHWPIIVFTRYLNLGMEAWLEGAMVFACALALGYLSWRFIEQPFRHGGGMSIVTPLVSGAAALGASVAVASTIIAYHGMPWRLSGDALQLYAATYDQSPFSQPRCFADTNGNGLSVAAIEEGRLCVVGDHSTTAPPSFVVWGDSHSAAMAPAIDLAARKAGIRGVLVGRGGCPPLPNAAFSSQKNVERCVDHNKAALSFIETQKIPYVFLVAYWPKYVHRSELPNQGIFFDPNIAPPVEDWSGPVRNSLEETITRLDAAGTKSVLVLDVPEMGVPVPEALARAVTTSRSEDIAPSRDYTDQRQSLARMVLNDVAKRKNAYLVDPLPKLCDATRCHAIINDTVMYKDADHLSASGARILAPIFDGVINVIAHSIPAQAVGGKPGSSEAIKPPFDVAF